ncbi:MAG: hypothetical protein H6666_08805 [Ardenticatenaceae bacterium]|nr:hypothetical protein [Anaerolineales bacterium]MCB8918012.1 hypothetical protein [Ardenticatenaceae bacterium]
MSVPTTLSQLLSQPAPGTIWQLRSDLLEAGYAPDADLWRVLDQAYHFFTELATKATAREYSHFASLLDIGAIGLVVVENLLDAEQSENFWGKVIGGALSEGLMVMAARQYVKAWEEEMRSVYQSSAWTLYHELWRLSERLQPGLPAGERRQLLEQLLAPLHNPDFSGNAKALIIARLYQLLILTYVTTGTPRPGA